MNHRKILAAFLFHSLILLFAVHSARLFGQDAPPVLFERAQEAMREGRYSEASDLYRQLIVEFPEVTGLRLNLGISLFLQDRLGEAVPHLQAVVDSGEELMPAWFFLGSAYLGLERFEESVSSLSRYVDAEPSDPQGRHMLANAYLAMDQPEKAKPQLQKLTELEPKSPTAWFQLGRVYGLLAESTFERLEQRAPDSAYWLALIGDSQLSRGEFRSAFFFYRKALEKHPKMRGIHVALSRIYRETGNEEWARQAEEKESSLGLPDCEKEAVVCAFLQGDFLRTLELAGKIDGPEGDYWSVQAYNQLASEAFAQLGGLPSSFELHSIAAEIHQNQGRFLEAARDWRQALERRPEDRSAKTGLAFALFFSRNYDEAEPLVDELLADSPDDPQLNYLAGAMRLNREEPEASLEYLNKAVRLDPEDLSARSSLGRALLALGRQEEAVPHLEKALSTDQDGSLHYQLAQAHRAVGNQEKARETLQKYQELQSRTAAERDELEEEFDLTPP
ncbi:MAG TPA: tetratricopeptide repeat protein [Acidobacteriota bacterium]|nr:tetratricopeptide repeat protein [Acidobacteriota bacterium]